LKTPRFWIGMAISAVALVVAFMRIDFEEAREAFRAANYLWLVPATGAAIASLFLRSIRWRALFSPLDFPVTQLFGIMTIGFTVNTVLPLRVGDVARAHLIKQVHDESRMRAFSTVMVEHLADAVVVLLLLLALAPFLPFPEWAETATWGAAGIVMVGGVVVVALWFCRGKALSVFDRLGDLIPWVSTESIHEKVDSLIEGFSALDSGRALAKVAVWSILMWLSGGLMMWAVLIAFGLPHSFQAGIFLVTMSAIALTIPSSPGFVGVYHVLLIEAAALVLDVSRGAAAGFAVVTHLLLFVPPIILAIIYMVARPQVWDDLLHWHRQRPDDG
jgi:glycosyltransferase 2 family protein